MADRKQKQGKCIYCGAMGDITDDHVPPKGLFPKPRPSNLITVPACESCNGGEHLDDEYFRLMLAMRHDTADLPALKPVLEAVFRSLGKTEKRKFARSFISRYKRRQVHTPRGIFLGVFPAYDVDRNRVLRVVERTGRGIFFNQMGRGLADGYTAIAVDELKMIEADTTVRELVQRHCTQISQAPPFEIAGGLFRYWFHILEEDPNVSTTLMLFYHRVPFLCITGPDIRQRNTAE